MAIYSMISGNYLVGVKYRDCLGYQLSIQKLPHPGVSRAYDKNELDDSPETYTKVGQEELYP